MTPEKRKTWLRQEEKRLTNYQHQHRGLSFLKLLLPPSTDRKVSLVGLDNHIYRGSIPRIPEDRLPPDVDEKSIDEEELYKDIRDMNFPSVPENEPLGPPRRIEGSYTLTKKLTLAPVQVNCKEGLKQTLILGKDSGFYKGMTKYASKVELSKQLRGTKRLVKKMRQQSSARGFVEPSLISLHAENELVPYDRDKKSQIKLPLANIGEIIELIKVQNREDGVKRNESTSETSKVKQAEEVQQEEESKETGGSEEAEETKESERYKPAEESKRYEPSEESERYEPAEESERYESEQYGPAEESEQYGPAEESEQYGPAEESERYGLAEESERYGPAEESESSEPAVESEPSEPAEESQSSEPAEESQSSEPAEESQSSEPVEESQSSEPADDSEQSESTEESKLSEPSEESEVKNSEQSEPWFKLGAKIL